jgi:hypothetical protein
MLLFGLIIMKYLDNIFTHVYIEYIQTFFFHRKIVRTILRFKENVLNFDCSDMTPLISD